MDGQKIAGLEEHIGPYTAIVKGDASSYAIACASVVAKVTRDRLMARLALRYPGYGWEHNAGYATRDHVAGLRALGVTPFHRRTYQRIRGILAATSWPSTWRPDPGTRSTDRPRVAIAIRRRAGVALAHPSDVGSRALGASRDVIGRDGTAQVARHPGHAWVLARIRAREVAVRILQRWRGGHARTASADSRRLAGDLAEDAVARHLVARGWTILARNVRVGRSELDIVARRAVGAMPRSWSSRCARARCHASVRRRSRSTRPRSARLYAAAWRPRCGRGSLPDGVRLAGRRCRVDLVTVVREGDRCPVASVGPPAGLAPPWARERPRRSAAGPASDPSC